jgi:hypothetical protein
VDHVHELLSRYLDTIGPYQVRNERLPDALRCRLQNLVPHLGKSPLQFIAVAAALASASSNIELPTGMCPFVGVAGFTLGGGIGLLSRYLGLMCDNMVSIEALGEVKVINVTKEYLEENGVRVELLEAAAQGSGRVQLAKSRGVIPS